MRIDDLLEKTYWIIDILPEQVSKDSPGQYFAIEEHYLKEPQAAILRRKLSNIILKLNCYYDISVANNFEDDASDSAVTNPDPEKLVNLFAGPNSAEYICILVGNEDTLIVSNRDDTYMTVYNPTPRILNLIQLLAEAEGFFVWKP